jgi:CheY-like chemotaxis protein
MTTSKSCILIDDDLDDQEVFLSAVHDVAADVNARAETDAGKMFSELQQTAQLPDLIFVDINMPKMDGFEFMILMQRHIRLRSVPIVFYSTTSVDEQIQKAFALGAKGFITKTNSYKELCEIIKKYLESPII